MRVLMLNYEFPPLGGGAANATYYILKEFAKYNDVTIDLVTSSVDEAKTEQFADSITIHSLDIGKGGNVHYQSNKDLLTYSWKAYRYAKRLARENTYDVIHAFFGIPCGYIAMKLKLPYIVSLRGSDVPFYNPRFKTLDTLVFKRMSKKIWKRAQKVIANSYGLKALANESAPDEEIDVISNGVDTEFFAPAKTKTGSDTLTLVSTGRLIKRKGFDYLIRALEGVDGVRLVLIGGGNQREELQALAGALHVDVSFPGTLGKNEVLAHLQKSDIFILPSLNEGMSNSVLEAMAVGLPCIVTDVGGSGELINGNGIICAKADEKALRESVMTYKDDVALLKKHGEASRERACAMSWKQCAERYRKIYLECF